MRADYLLLWRRLLLISALVLHLGTGPAANAQESPPSKTKKDAAADSAKKARSGSVKTDDLMKQARAQVEKFFGEPFPKTFEIKTFANRADLTDFARKRWGMEKTDCWMVAMGVSSTLVILSPDVWKTQACEHEPTPAHIREILTHEMVHVFHGQHNPSHEFDGMDDVGWFVEGLAVHASNQLSEDRMSRFRTSLAAGRAPTKLVNVWSGQDRYGAAGSLVRYIETRWGRDTLKKLLGATSNAEILKTLGVSEDELLTAWLKSLAATQTTSNRSTDAP